MITIHHTVAAAVSLEVAFDYVDDYRHVPDWMFGITRFEPRGVVTHGLGATFDTAMKVGPTALPSVVQVTAWEKNRLIGLDAVEGFVTTSRWQFHDAGDQLTTIEVDFGYELPGGLAGRALGHLLGPFVTQAIRHTDAALRHNLDMLA
ncbi:SRPBCC family protein [Rhodococcus maanshanensis]|uniref:SRPBCC family protein n=1 Tax=Rhodococcus maanshanensis TaxID=183556 RepID=UPI0022B4C87C|nr:SRPBCC family protein [Rhodococcus maanshanensis]MCZ4558659.1 SRPBCC family protein [Rhodococcus maanshanensis]